MLARLPAEGILQSRFGYPCGNILQFGGHAVIPAVQKAEKGHGSDDFDYLFLVKMTLQILEVPGRCLRGGHCSVAGDAQGRPQGAGALHNPGRSELANTRR